MAAPKGHPKWGGIQKGTKHKRSEFREAIESGLGKSIPERILEIISMGGMDPGQEAEILVKILPYCFHKLTSIDVSGSLDVNHSESELIEAEAAEVLRLVDMK